ncbi:coatomer subunit beta'-like [Sycon ciliatum]|uniref:coatomer subunit beta'-like n=1 Tax=Sycon ciliatum TaxID=27933 RepID=UPI0020AED5D3|eukprot:scpid42102/ scgid19815/ Coatomer subunit beta&apos; Beta&apos; p102
MPLRLDVKRKFSSRSDRVKSADLHPTESWLLVSLFNGAVHIWDYEKAILVKQFEVTNLPVRAAKFVARKSWVVTGSDDMCICVFNYNTLDKVHSFEAHTDYIRSIAVHPSQPYLLSSSDDSLIKLWDWDKKWQCTQVFEGHTHFVMQVVFNPKENNIFASASLDCKIKVWQIGQPVPNFTLEGHTLGINCLDYFQGGDKPYLVSGADDKLVKIWDYQNKTCVQTLEGHAQNVSTVAFHPELPIIITGSEDDSVRVWNSSTYRLETTLNYGLERVWCMAYCRGSNCFALGYDEGCVVLTLGREEPAMSMDSSGKLIFAKHSEIQQANLRALADTNFKDGERLTLAVKDMGSCDIFPQSIQHNPNGRFVVMCGDGEYIISTAMALRNKAFGSGIQEFVWAADSSEYAVRDMSFSKVKIYKNFKERKSFSPQYGAEGIFGGNLLGVKSTNSLAFYTWDSLELVRRILIVPHKVYWSDNGELIAICTDEAYFILRFDQSAVDTAFEHKEDIDPEDGIEQAFDFVSEISEVVRSGVWVGDCFIYSNSVNRLNYFVGGEIITISHLERKMYILGYLPKENRVYLGDKDVSVTSYSLPLSVLEYQTAVMRKDFDTADKYLPQIPDNQRTRVARFLEKQGFKKQALQVTTDVEHKFEIAVAIKDVAAAVKIAREAQSESRWKQLADLALGMSELGLAKQCLVEAKDYNGQLLLATSTGDRNTVQCMADEAKTAGKNNVAFLANYLLGNLDGCIDLLVSTGRPAEAALFARSHRPSRMSDLVQLWKEELGKTNQKAADSLADPAKYPDLFPELKESLELEQQRQAAMAGNSSMGGGTAAAAMDASANLDVTTTDTTTTSNTTEPKAEQQVSAGGDDDDDDDFDLDGEFDAGDDAGDAAGEDMDFDDLDDI